MTYVDTIMSFQGNPIGPVGRIARLAFAVSAAILVSGILDPARAQQPRGGGQRQNSAEERSSQPRRLVLNNVHRQQRGVASYYARKFNGRRTASGVRFDPRSDTAAHRTLPMGSVARVTNLSNGRSAIVTIRDRGPFIRGRILDLSPRTASELGMMNAGIATVSLEPIHVPPPGRGG